MRIAVANAAAILIFVTRSGLECILLFEWGMPIPLTTYNIICIIFLHRLQRATKVKK